jgi:hypothetical protein
VTNGPFRLIRPFLALAVVAFVAAGCSDDDDDDVSGPGSQGNLQVFATDAPPELDRLRNVIVSIQRIEAIGAVSTGGVSNVVPLYDASISGVKEVDLLPLKGGAREQLASGPVPPDLYDRVRVFFSDIEVRYETTNGVEEFSTNNGDLIFGGDQQQGVDFVEFDLPDPGVDVDVGESEQILLDFDLAESLDLQGATDDPTTITFTPTGQARTLTSDSGALAGVVRTDASTPAQPGDDTPVQFADVSLRQNNTVVANTRSDAGGVYLIEGVEPGQYELVVTDPDDANDQFLSDININDGQTTTADALLSSTAPVATN